MRQRSKAEWREGGGRVVFLALPSLGLYNGTPEMRAFHRYLLCLSPDQAALHRHSASSQRPYPWGQTPHPSLLPVPFPVGLILTLAQGKSTESPRDGQHQHGAASFSELCPPPQGRRKGARCCLPHQGLQRSSSASPAPWLGERPALAKLWLLVLFKGLMARHPRGVAASP